ncbi:hypothetical protein [Streptacidiphilus jiangxiensis]|nr:hypothetical protein [Streptacidiphilus jiangxiensis]
MSARIGHWLCYKTVQAVGDHDGNPIQSNPVRVRDDSTHYTYYADIFYGVGDTPLGEVFTRAHLSLRGYAIQLDQFQIARVRGAGADISAELKSRLVTAGPYGVYPLDSRACGPSGWLAGATFTCPKIYEGKADEDLNVSLVFSWTNQSEPNPSSPDGYWSVLESTKTVQCRANRTVVCQVMP